MPVGQTTLEDIHQKFSRYLNNDKQQRSVCPYVWLYDDDDDDDDIDRIDDSTTTMNPLTGIQAEDRIIERDVDDAIQCIETENAKLTFDPQKKDYGGEHAQGIVQKIGEPSVDGTDRPCFSDFKTAINLASLNQTIFFHGQEIKPCQILVNDFRANDLQSVVGEKVQARQKKKLTKRRRTRRSIERKVTSKKGPSAEIELNKTEGRQLRSTDLKKKFENVADRSVELSRMEPSPQQTTANTSMEDKTLSIVEWLQSSATDVNEFIARLPDLSDIVSKF